jgi:hypothetical protein
LFFLFFVFSFLHTSTAMFLHKEPKPRLLVTESALARAEPLVLPAQVAWPCR